MLHGLGEVYRVSEKNAMEIQQAVVHHITQAKQFNFYIGRKSCYLAFCHIVRMTIKVRKILIKFQEKY
jgi:hypothetical protein